MGLDMYLTKETYIGNNFKNKKDQVAIDIPCIDQSKVSSITEQVGYWRKSNAIHKWFVDNVQGGIDDCGRYRVSQEQMEELLDLVNKVLTDHSLAEDLLPLQVGDTDTNEWYFNYLEDTKKIIEEVFSDDSRVFVDHYYRSSW